MTNLDQLFGPRRAETRWPSPAEIEWQWHIHQRELVERAQRAQQFGYSYNRVKPVSIGCSVLAYRHDAPEGEKFRAFDGWNYTLSKRPFDRSRIKWCAERMGVTSAIEAGYTLIVGVVIYTDHNQADDITGLVTRLFMACKECDDFFLPIVPPTAKILSVRPALPCDFNPDGTPAEFTTMDTDYQTLRRWHDEVLAQK